VLPYRPGRTKIYLDRALCINQPPPFSSSLISRVERSSFTASQALKPIPSSLSPSTPLLVTISAAAGKRKPSRRATIQESPAPDEPSSSPHPTIQLGEYSDSSLTPIGHTDPTPSEQTQTIPQESANIPIEADLQTQPSSNVTSNLGAPVQLTEQQFHTLLARFAAAGPNLVVPTTTEPLQQDQRPETGAPVGPVQGGAPDESPSHSSSGGHRRGYQDTPRVPRHARQYDTPFLLDRRSPKHDNLSYLCPRWSRTQLGKSSLSLCLPGI
jgi:hypothetical protein